MSFDQVTNVVKGFNNTTRSYSPKYIVTNVAVVVYLNYSKYLGVYLLLYGFPDPRVAVVNPIFYKFSRGVRGKAIFLR